MNHQLFPKIQDRAFWDSFLPDYRAAVQTKADAILAKPLTITSLYDYLLTHINGDRATYENVYFDRRNKLLNLFAAYCATGDKEKYFRTIVDYVGAIDEERFWCIPAHANALENDPFVKESTAMKAELFSCGTAALMGLILSILHDDLAELSPSLLEYLRQHTIHRVLDSVLDPERKQDYWWMDRTNGRFNNWTPWCCYNLLTAAICLGDDDLVDKTVKRTFPPVKRYFDESQDDGYCLEGASYWGVADGSLLGYLMLLQKCAPELANPIINSEKFRLMGEYIVHMKMQGDYIACYSDNHARTRPSSLVVYLLGQLTNSPLLKGYASSLVRSLRGKAVEESASLPHMALVRFFTAIPDSETFELPALSYYKDRLGIARHSQGFSAFLKAGDNSESHNHNDLGHVAIFFKDDPVVLDAGTERYGLKNFSNMRYELWYTGAQGHNAPFINGVKQQDGAQYKATLPQPVQNGQSVTFVADLSKAYPAEAGVKAFTRTLTVAEKSVLIQDDICAEKLDDVLITLYSTHPITVKDGIVFFGAERSLTLDGLTTGDITSVPVDSNLKHDYGTDTFYTIQLKGNSPRYTMRFE